MIIEKNVPVPEPRKQAKYPFNDMQVGDSFFVPLETANNGSIRSAARSSEQKRGHEGWKFIVRAVDGGHRVWRVS